MDSLIQDVLDFLQETAKTQSSVLLTAEEAAYFAPSLAIKTPPPSPLPSLIERKSQLPSPPQKIAVSPPSTPSPTPAKLAQDAVDVVQPLPKVVQKKDFNDIRQMVQKNFPELLLRETIPEDAMAKRMSRLWEESYLAAEVVILAFSEVGPGLEFLKQVTAAIDKLLAPAQLIEGLSFEKERRWDLLFQSPSLKMVVASPWACWKTTSLSKYYRQNGSTGDHFLGERRLLFLEPSLMYLKHPDRKRQLWKTLNTHLSS